MKPFINITLIVGFILLSFISCSEQQKPINLSKVAEHDWIDIRKIDALRFGWMKMEESNTLQLVTTYFPESMAEVEIYVPVDGEIKTISPMDNTNPLQNVTLIIQAKDDPAISVKIHSIDLNSDEWGVGSVVKAGMYIGMTNKNENPSIVVLYQNEKNTTSHLFLDITADYVFENYQQRGIESRDIIIRLHQELQKNKNSAVEHEIPLQ